MSQQFHAFALVVRDYDEAIDWYTRALDFQLLEDTPMDAAKRWVRIVPRGSQGACLLLARAVNDEQASRIGKQAGGGFPSSAIPMISSATVRACRRKACISVKNRVTRTTARPSFSRICTAIYGI